MPAPLPDNAFGLYLMVQDRPRRRDLTRSEVRRAASREFALDGIAAARRLLPEGPDLNDHFWDIALAGVELVDSDPRASDDEFQWLAEVDWLDAACTVEEGMDPRCAFEFADGPQAKNHMQLPEPTMPLDLKVQDYPSRRAPPGSPLRQFLLSAGPGAQQLLVRDDLTADELDVVLTQVEPREIAKLDHRGFDDEIAAQSAPFSLALWDTLLGRSLLNLETLAGLLGRPDAPDVTQVGSWAAEEDRPLLARMALLWSGLTDDACAARLAAGTAAPTWKHGDVNRVRGWSKSLGPGAEQMAEGGVPPVAARVVDLSGRDALREALLASGHWPTVVGVLGNPTVGDVDLATAERLLERFGDEAGFGEVAGFAGVPPTLLKLVEQDERWAASALANAAVDVALLDAYAAGPARDRIAVAVNPSTPPGLLAELAGDSAVTVRRAVAGNPLTPPAALVELAEDGDDAAAAAAAANPSTPAAAVLRVLARPPGLAMQAAMRRGDIVGDDVLLDRLVEVDQSTVDGKTILNAVALYRRPLTAPLQEFLLLSSAAGALRRLTVDVLRNDMGAEPFELTSESRVWLSFQDLKALDVASFGEAPEWTFNWNTFGAPGTELDPPPPRPKWAFDERWQKE